MKGFPFVPLVCALTLAFSVNAALPTIDPSQPADATVNLASAVEFSIVATNAASYQWRTNGSAFPGATNATFALDNVTSNSVDVVVTSADGESITSRAAKLNVIPGTVVNMTITGYQGNQSNVVTIQLFDHDKPATVENFIHYITARAYTNMFFERLVPNFILQGGDFGASDRTNNDTPVVGDTDEIYSVDSSFVQSFIITPNLPLWVDSEFDVGPLIHNRFGTVAMAKKAGNPDSAENGFFFNLADNSTNLDIQNGGYTVFGRVTSGSNVLAYFNTLSKPDKGVFDESTVDDNPLFTDLPVNFSSFAIPVNTNLFYADFSFPSAPVVNTNLPFATKTNMMIDTNTGDVQFSGTASDGVGVARVWGGILSGSPFITLGPLNSLSSSNWTVDCGVLPGGSNYTFVLTAQNGAGYTVLSNYTFSVPAFPLRVGTNGRGTFTPVNAATTNLAYKASVTLKAKASPGSVFVGWTMGTNEGTLDPTFTVVNKNGGSVTANFISNNLPGGVRFTFPTAGARLTNPRPTLSGALAKTAPAPSLVTTRLFSRSSKSLLYSTNLINLTSNAWSVDMPELAPGLYTAQVVATAPSGKAAVVYQNFDVLGAVAVVINGPGRANFKAGTNFLEINQREVIQATPLAGASFHDIAGASLERFSPTGSFELSSSDTVENPLVLTLTFFSNSVPKSAFTVTSPKPGAVVRIASVTVTGTLSNLVRVTCQAFTNNADVEASTDVIEAKISGTNWSAVLPNLPPGGQKLVAIGYDSQGRTRLIEQAFTMNLLGTAAGVYSGLMIANDVSVVHSGMFTLTITSNGVASGKMIIPGVWYLNQPFVYPLRTTFPIGGVVEFSPGGFNNQTLLVLLQLFASPGIIQGEVGQATWSTEMFGYLQPNSLTSTNNPAPGNYVMLYTPTNSTNVTFPSGAGYGFLTISNNGTFQLAGTLSDNSTFSEGSTASSFGYLPIYSVPSGYKNKGMFIGWQSIDTNTVNSASMYWVKGATGGNYYPNGFASPQLLIAGGGLFQPPTNGQYSIVFSGGTLTNSVTNTLTFASGQFQTTSNVAALNLSTNNGTTGLITGQFIDPSGAVASFQGAFVSPTTGGAGFILETNQTTGAFTLSAAP